MLQCGCNGLTIRTQQYSNEWLCLLQCGRNSLTLHTQQYNAEWVAVWLQQSHSPHTEYISEWVHVLRCGRNSLALHTQQYNAEWVRVLQCGCNSLTLHTQNTVVSECMCCSVVATVTFYNRHISFRRKQQAWRTITLPTCLNLAMSCCCRRVSKMLWDVIRMLTSWMIRASLHSLVRLQPAVIALFVVYVMKTSSVQFWCCLFGDFNGVCLSKNLLQKFQVFSYGY